MKYVRVIKRKADIWIDGHSMVDTMCIHLLQLNSFQCFLFTFQYIRVAFTCEFLGLMDQWDKFFTWKFLGIREFSILFNISHVFSLTVDFSHLISIIHFGLVLFCFVEPWAQLYFHKPKCSIIYSNNGWIKTTMIEMKDATRAKENNDSKANTIEAMKINKH